MSLYDNERVKTTDLDVLIDLYTALCRLTKRQITFIPKYRLNVMY